VDESVDATRCQGQSDCQGGERCLTHSLWQDLSERISLFLDSISLGELMDKSDVQAVAHRQDNNKHLNKLVLNEIEVNLHL
jgi:Rrf2 family iron-sulfur cluster assembly transcriptional regulator